MPAQEGKLAGCALDVFEFEPLPADSPLRSMDNVLIAPHNSNSSPTAHENVQWNTIRNLCAPPPTPAPLLPAGLTFEVVVRLKGLGIPYEDYAAEI